MELGYLTPCLLLTPDDPRRPISTRKLRLRNRAAGPHGLQRHGLSCLLQDESLKYCLRGLCKEGAPDRVLSKPQPDAEMADGCKDWADEPPPPGVLDMGRYI